MNSGLVWHYTTGLALTSISQSGVLIPKEAVADPGRKPVLWFSSVQLWENMATKPFESEGKTIRPTLIELHKLYGVYRFGISRGDERLCPWYRLIRVAGFVHDDAREIAEKAMRIGSNPVDWYGAFNSIDLKELHFEAWDKNGWNSADLSREAMRRMRVGLDRTSHLIAVGAN